MSYKNLGWYKLAALLMVLALIIPILVACSSSNNDKTTNNPTGPNIIGKWFPVNAQDAPSYSGWSYVKSFEFLKDGTFIVGASGGGISTSSSGEYYFIDDTHIKFQSPSGESTFVFTISGNTLTLLQPDGTAYKLQREYSQPSSTLAVPSSSSSLTSMMISADNLRILGSFDNVAQAYDTSSPSYLKLYWTYVQQLVVPNSATNLYAVGKYTQTKDGAGNYPGECVSLVKALTNTSDLNTASWGIGKRVMEGGVMPGTAIATFTKNNNTQFNSGIDHAAIFKGYLADGSGFEVWDQNWDFTGVVGTHAIKIIGSKGYPNTYANNYYVIQIPLITLQQPVATINSTTISMDYFIKMLRYYSLSSNGNLSSSSYPYQVLQQIESDELVRQAAPRLGIQVTPDEVTEKINNDLISSAGGGKNATGNITLPQTELGKMYQQWLNYIRLSDSEYRHYVEATLLTQKLNDQIKQSVPTEGKQVHVYAIKVDNEGNATKAENRLKNGEDFSTIAAEYSIDNTTKQYGGDLGWVPQGLLIPELDKAAFSLAAGNVSEPIATSEGFYVIKVAEIDENRPIGDQYRQILASNEFSNWFTEQRNVVEIREYLNQTKVTWAMNHIT